MPVWYAIAHPHNEVEERLLASIFFSLGCTISPGKESDIVGAHHVCWFLPVSSDVQQKCFSTVCSDGNRTDYFVPSLESLSIDPDAKRRLWCFFIKYFQEF